MTSDPATRPYVVDLYSRGFIQGVTYLSNGKPLCHYFGGVPYALQPTGGLRWRKPQPLAPDYSYGTEKDPGVFTGKTAVCPQPGNNSATSEDCSQVNIWVPTGDAPKNGRLDN